jgi:Tol biopolymer transport system component
VDGRDVNIIYTDAEGAPKALTSSGVNTEPSLSADKSSVVFLREPNSSEKEIWAIRTDGSGLRPLFRGPVRWKNGTYPSSTLRSPQWSAEGKAVYFVTDFSSTTGALWRLDLTSGKTAVIIPDAVMYGVIQTGRYRGFLVANQRSLSRPEPDGSRYPVYPFFLYTPLGEKVRLVGEENGDDDLEPLLEDWEHR